MINYVRKRNGNIVQFNSEKVVTAIRKAGETSGEFGPKRARRIAAKVLSIVESLYSSKTPGVEDIQDIVHDKIETLIKHVDNPYVVTRDLIDLRVLVLHKDKLNIDLIKNLVKYRVSKNILSQLLNTFTIKGLDYLLKSPMFIVARKMENKYLASVIYNLINIYQN